MEQEKQKRSTVQRISKGFSIIVLATIAFIGVNFTVPILGQSNGSIIVANAAQTASDAFNSVQSSAGGVLGSGIKDKVTKLSADSQNLILTGVMGILICSTLISSTKFSGAGDNATKKTALKSALIFQVLGIVFVASYSGLILFGLKNLNLFS